MLAEHGPIGDEFTKVTIVWTDGAYYMTVRTGRSRHWKVVLAPPLRDMDWRVRIISRKGERVERVLKGQKHIDASVAWSRTFARVVPNLPARFADASAFKIRVTTEDEQVVYFMEVESPPAWTTFKVKLSGEFVPLDWGF
ncbi:MAG TPA: hypothetical protein PKA27_07750 [Fimbriimonadaceae bacterium]|nr:hypothetical protein [Fimbriimonadaceae bacterium]